MLTQNTKNFIIYSTILIMLYFTTFVNYLLFHSISELFSIIISSTIFIIVWNSRQYIRNNYLLFIGIAYLFIGFLDLLHTISYKGMAIFTDYDYYANQLWVIARYMESITLVFGFIYFVKDRKINEYKVFGIYSIISLVGIMSIFYWKIFPECFIEGEGQTQFKIISEYIINIILIVGVFYLRKNKDKFDAVVYKYIFVSIIFTIISELAFTFYISNYGFSNLIGHYAKLISFFLIYKALIKTAIEKPYDLIFRELEKQREELSLADKTKNRFFSVISHDLRSPFNGLLGIVDILENDYDNLEEEERKEFVNDISNSSHRIFKLVENLLEWSRTQLGSVEYNPVTKKIENIVTESIEIASISAKNKRIEINYQNNAKDVNVYIDENMIYTVFRNLISNAVKFSNKNSKIDIITNTQGNFVNVAIQDYGKGMSEKIKNKLLKIEHKISTVGTEGESGTGLGLIIVKEFIEKNGGELWFESEEKRGTTFYFSLPIKR